MPGTSITTWTFDASSAAIVVATIIGPVLAVQAQKWLERGRAINERRAQIFRVLMATRAARLSPGHVEALNAISVEFYGPNKPKLKAITDAWQLYFDALKETSLSDEGVAVLRANRLTDLLHTMSSFLGYDFSKSDLADVYSPIAHQHIETDQDAIRRGFAMVLKGEASIPMNVTGFPFDEDATAKQLALNALITEWLEGKRAVRVEPSNEAR